MEDLLRLKVLNLDFQMLMRKKLTITKETQTCSVPCSHRGPEAPGVLRSCLGLLEVIKMVQSTQLILIRRTILEACSSSV